MTSPRAATAVATTNDLATLLADTIAAAVPAPAARAVVHASVRQLLRERAEGHVCLSLAAWAGRTSEEAESPFPALAAWTEALRQSGVCGDAGHDAPARPLVLDGKGRLYLRRDHAAERTIVQFVQRRLAAAPSGDAAALHDDLAGLGFLPENGDTIDWQLVAIAAARRRSLLVLTGGPGTGKTTTIAKALAVLLRREPTLRIALCAPTGKAASRLHEALRQRGQQEPAFATVAANCTPTTLHRLLGYLPVEDRFRRSRQSPLHHDVVVVDEASMADPALLAVLCEALPDHARLWLVGDRDQLAAVAAGQVLGDLCRAAAAERGPGRDLAAFATAASGQPVPARANAPALADVVVPLQHSHRFGTRPGIGGFAQALARRDAAAAMQVLQHGHGDLALVARADAALATIAEALLAAVRADAGAAVQQLARARILTATRHGPAGTLAWNQRVEAMLRQHGVRADEPYYPGRPILVTANDQQNHVYNGDLGVVVWHEGRPQVAFARGDGSVRFVAPRRLPAHETAWAMTVHKAQGSEFDRVLLAMPDKPGPWWQAPLLYTGITRARERAVLCADATLLAPALAFWPQRSSGLADAFG